MDTDACGSVDVMREAVEIFCSLLFSHGIRNQDY